jgi:hypothetical protein
VAWGLLGAPWEGLQALLPARCGLLSGCSREEENSREEREEKREQRKEKKRKEEEKEKKKKNQTWKFLKK